MCERCGYTGEERVVYTLTVFMQGDKYGATQLGVGIHTEMGPHFEEFCDPANIEVTANDYLVIAKYFADISNRYILAAVGKDLVGNPPPEVEEGNEMEAFLRGEFDTLDYN